MKIASKERTEPIEHERGRFASTRYKVGEAAGARELGASLYEVGPGKTAWPRHAHLGNEEAIYILEGSGVLRVGDETKSVVAGDFVSFPRGKAHAHQLVNDSDSTLAYLCVSTMNEPDITFYPDSNKCGVFAGSAPGSSTERELQGCFELDSTVDYFMGET